MDTIHDSKILNYNIDFEHSKLEIKAMTEKGKQIKILFEDFFAYHFENQLPNSILLDIVEEDVNSFALALKESVQSTKIEGTQVTFTDMVNEKQILKQKAEHIEVLNYRKALSIGQERIQNGYPLTTRLVLDLHKVLMEGARGTNASSGEFRKVPNWIGPTKRFEDAVYVPIEADEIESYMENWEVYANTHPYGEKMDIGHLSDEEFILDENIHPLLKVAILHAQFESISVHTHSFVSLSCITES